MKLTFTTMYTTPHRPGRKVYTNSPQIALDTFVDNVAILGVEAKLLTDLPNILTAEDIAGLDADEVTAIASEPPEAQKERQRLHAQCEALQDTVATCRMHGGQSTCK